MTQPDKSLAKIAEGAFLRPHAEISPVMVKDTLLMNNKLPLSVIPAERGRLWYVYLLKN